MALNAPAIYAAAIVVTILSLVSVLGRFGIRWAREVGFGADDWTSLAGLLGVISIMGVSMAGTSEGVFGTHTAIDPKTHAGIIGPQDRLGVQYQWIVIVLTVPTIAMIKLSVIFLYRRIFDMSQKFEYYSVVLVVLVVAWAVGFLFSELFQCGRHIAAFWRSAKDIQKYCDDTNGAIIAFCVSDLIMDLMILLTPVPMVWRLVTTTKRRLQILGVFALGFLSTAGSAVRLAILVKAVYGTTLGYRDVREQASLIVLWSVIEVNAALIGCSLPTLRPLFSDKGLRSVVNSIRSALSLHSLQSRYSDSRREENVVGPTRPEAAAVVPISKIESRESK